jgi:hypothetical protein
LLPADLAGTAKIEIGVSVDDAHKAGFSRVRLACPLASAKRQNSSGV